MTSSLIDALTPREREILALIAEGDSLSEIAQKLSRSLKTIESHRLSLGRKLKAGNRVELAKIAIASGLVPLPVSDDAQQTTAASEKQLRWIEQINSAIHQATGRVLMQRFCDTASQLPGVDIAAICTSEVGPSGDEDPYSRMIMAISDRGKVGKPLRYNAVQTPCQQIIENGMCSIPRGIQEFFPNDPWLAEIDAQGYLGMGLTDIAGKQIGGVGLIGREPLEDLEAFRYLVEFFAPRLAGALQTYKEIELLRSQNDRLQSDLLDPVMRGRVESPVQEQQAMKIVRREISQRVHQLAGAAFLRALIDAVCDVFGLYAGGVCALDSAPGSPTLHTVTFCIQNSQGDAIRYQAKGTPCEIVLQRSGLCLEDNAAEAYPADVFMQEHQIRGFCGNRLPGPDGRTAGVIWVVNQAPLREHEAIEALLKYYAPRIGAELANFMQLERLMQEREQLEERLAKQRNPRPRVQAS